MLKITNNSITAIEKMLLYQNYNFNNNTKMFSNYEPFKEMLMKNFNVVNNEDDATIFIGFDYYDDKLIKHVLSKKFIGICMLMPTDMINSRYFNFINVPTYEFSLRAIIPSLPVLNEKGTMELWPMSWFIWWSYRFYKQISRFELSSNEIYDVISVDEIKCFYK